MGGFNSGRRRTRTTGAIECARSIDVGKLNRNGCLVTGWAGSWQWTRDGNQVATIGLTAHQGSLRLTYRWRLADNEWNDVDERVGIVWRNCPFGGRRPLFLCPGVVNGRICGRAVLKLYGADRFFLCRHCYRLSYASQSEDPWDRALRRANKIRTRLGGEPGTAAVFPRPICRTP
jgi:hypothetical protein